VVFLFYSILFILCRIRRMLHRKMAWVAAQGHISKADRVRAGNTFCV
jgi:hypothetical protein